jgi:hypothetical protein
VGPACQAFERSGDFQGPAGGGRERPRRRRNSWRAAYRRAVAQSAGRGRVGGDPSPAGVRHPKASWTTPATFSRLGGSGVDANDYRGSVGIAPVMCTGYSHGRIANRQLKRPEVWRQRYLLKDAPRHILLESIRKVHGGETCLSPKTSRASHSATTLPATTTDLQLFDTLRTLKNYSVSRITVQRPPFGAPRSCFTPR